MRGLEGERVLNGRMEQSERIGRVGNGDFVLVVCRRDELQLQKSLILLVTLQQILIF